mgnify:CR=1 FL=1
MAECDLNNGACGIDLFTRCVEQLGGPPRCVDVDECAVDNGGCGDRRFRACVNALAGPPACVDAHLCAPDGDGANACGEARYWQCIERLGALPVCTDLDECRAINGENACGRAIDFQCENVVGAAPLCAACAPGSFNLDLQGGDGCEYACTPTGAELCNRVDDNCDGRVDEGYDLLSRADHCGACGAVCGALPNAPSTACTVGRCLVVACAPGFRDENGEPEDGCEAPVPEAEDGVIYVDAFNVQDAPDGSLANPFRHIQDGVAAAAPGQVVRVAAGAYAESVVIATPGVLLEGVGPDQVLIRTAFPYGIGVRIVADDVTVAGFTVDGGRFGVQIGGPGWGAPRRAHVYNVSVTGLAPPQATTNVDGLSVAGIYAENADEVTIAQCRVTGVRGGQGGSEPLERAAGQRGGTAAGIWLSDVRGATVTGNVIDQVVGGSGYVPRNVGAGGVGGAAGGIWLQGATACRVDHNAILAVDGGTGGGTGSSGGGGGAGGVGRGIYLSDGSSQVVLEDNRVEVVRGGRGGVHTSSDAAHCCAGAGGSAVGLHVNGARLTRVRGLELRSLVGGEAGTRGGNYNGGNGGAAIGGLLTAAADAELRGVLVWDVTGGPGASMGGAVGLDLDNANQTVVDGFTLDGVGIAGNASGLGVRLRATQISPVRLRHGIISRTLTACVRNDALGSAAQIAFTDLWDCGEADVVGPLTEAGPRFDEVPRYVDAGVGDLRLLPTSPLIDRGDPEVDAAREPAPNGCVVNLGAYGDTAFATAAGGDDVRHCP